MLTLIKELVEKENHQLLKEMYNEVINSFSSLPFSLIKRAQETFEKFLDCQSSPECDEYKRLLLSFIEEAEYYDILKSLEKYSGKSVYELDTEFKIEAQLRKLNKYELARNTLKTFLTCQ
jgi:hypothetical protein